MAGYNLVQREIDGRALNFYRKNCFRVVRDDLPRMPIEFGDVKLLSMSFSIGTREKPLHASAHAVDGYFFSLNFSQDLRPFAGAFVLESLGITQSWRSNVQ